MPSTDSSNFIADSAELIGDVSLGRDASVWFNATIRGDVNSIRIGVASNVQDNSVVHVSRDAPTTIGSYVTIGHGAVVHGCTIEDRVLIGIGAKILDGATVGSDSIIGAGALVTQKTIVPSRSMVVGVPARVVRCLTNEEVRSIRDYADRYVRYSRTYQSENRKPESIGGGNKERS